MNSRKSLSKVLMGVICSSFILTTGNIALASNLKVPSSGTPTSYMESCTVVKKHHNPKHRLSSEEMKPYLDKLVVSKTISQEQENKILSYAQKRAEERKAEKEKLKNMSEAERKAYWEQNKSIGKHSFFQELVDQKVISEEQEKAIKDTLPSPKEIRKEKELKFKSNLSELVKSGKITKDQENKINKFMKEKINEKEVEKEKLDKMNEAERKSYFEQNKSKENPDIIKELIEKKIITENEANLVREALPHHEQGMHP